MKLQKRFGKIEPAKDIIIYNISVDTRLHQGQKISCVNLSLEVICESSRGQRISILQESSSPDDT